MTRARDGHTLVSVDFPPSDSRYLWVSPARQEPAATPLEPLAEPGAATDVNVPWDEDEVATEVMGRPRAGTPRRPLATIPDEEEPVDTEVDGVASYVNRT